MATMIAAEIALRSEVEARIVALTPGREKNTRFFPAESVDGLVSKFAERFIGPRYFRISPPRDGGEHSTGYGYSFPVKLYDIEIQYPGGEWWTAAAESDRLAIQTDIRNNHGTTAGVQLRWFRDNYPWTMTPDDDDDWQILRMELTVHYEVEN